MWLPATKKSSEWCLVGTSDRAAVFVPPDESQSQRTLDHALSRATASINEGPIAEQLVSLLAPGSYAADQYRTLRHTIERAHLESGVNVLAVTSPAPGDG